MTWSLSAGKMLISDRGASSIIITNLDGSDSRTLIPSAGTNVRGIAIDMSLDLFFYADNGTDVIYKANLDGSEKVPIISSNLGFPADITIDPRFKKIYWCDRDNDKIESSDYDGGNRGTLINTESPYYLDLDLVNNKVYWGDFSGGNIFRANLDDGKDIEKIVESLIRTRGVKVDPYEGYYYWCDRESHKVQRKAITGGEIEDLYTGLDTPHGMTLDIKARKVYWVDTGTNSIGGIGAKAVNRGDMNGSGPQEILVSMSQPWDLTLDTRISNYLEWTQRRFFKESQNPKNGFRADPDNDGKNNLLEYLSGTNPLIGESIDPLSVTKIGENDELTYRVTSQPINDFRFRIEYSENLREWITLDHDPQRPEVDHDFGPMIISESIKIPPEKKRTYFRMNIESTK